MIKAAAESNSPSCALEVDTGFFGSMPVKQLAQIHVDQLGPLEFCMGQKEPKFPYPKGYIRLLLWSCMILQWPYWGCYTMVWPYWFPNYELLLSRESLKPGRGVIDSS